MDNGEPQQPVVIDEYVSRIGLVSRSRDQLQLFHVIPRLTTMRGL